MLQFEGSTMRSVSDEWVPTSVAWRYGKIWIWSWIVPRYACSHIQILVFKKIHPYTYLVKCIHQRSCISGHYVRLLVCTSGRNVRLCIYISSEMHSCSNQHSCISRHDVRLLVCTSVHVWICLDMHNTNMCIHIQRISRAFWGITSAF